MTDFSLDWPHGWVTDGGDAVTKLEILHAGSDFRGPANPDYPIRTFVSRERHVMDVNHQGISKDGVGRIFNAPAPKKKVEVEAWWRGG